MKELPDWIEEDDYEGRVISVGRKHPYIITRRGSEAKKGDIIIDLYVPDESGYGVHKRHHRIVRESRVASTVAEFRAEGKSWHEHFLKEEPKSKEELAPMPTFPGKKRYWFVQAYAQFKFKRYPVEYLLLYEDEEVAKKERDSLREYLKKHPGIVKRYRKGKNEPQVMVRYFSLSMDTREYKVISDWTGKQPDPRIRL